LIRILKNFYIAPNLDLSDRPKIFGMTASPIDATRGDVVDVATRLETILHSKILTARDLKLLQYCSKKPKEQVLVYPKSKPVFYKTDIYREMEENFGNIEMLKKSFIRIKHEHENLGTFQQNIRCSPNISRALGCGLSLEVPP
jgi:endoribonuclease Dicer